MLESKHKYGKKIITLCGLAIRSKEKKYVKKIN